MEKYKDVEINGRTFRVKKFPALAGAFITIKVTGLVTPLIKKAVEAARSGKDGEGDLDILSLVDELGKIKEEDFNYIQTKCLGVCSEVLPAGLSPVLYENGTFGVLDFDDDVLSVLTLTAHALMFNLMPVFQGAGLTSILASK